MGTQLSKPEKRDPVCFSEREGIPGIFSAGVEKNIPMLYNYHVGQGTVPKETVNGGIAMNILITEDDNTIRAALAVILRDNGFEPVFAADCREALARFSRCGLCLLDLMLGDGSGLDVLREIRKESSVPVIIIIDWSLILNYFVND